MKPIQVRKKANGGAETLRATSLPLAHGPVETISVSRIIERAKEQHGGKTVCAPCQIELRKGRPWDMGPAKTYIEYFGDLAQITGYLGKVLELSINGKKRFNLQMEDGFLVTSWHTSGDSQKLYLHARGKRVILIARVNLQGNHKFFNLEFFKWIGDQKVNEFGRLSG